jgi:hypothetical protein
VGTGECFGIGVGAYIGGGQFVLALPASFQVGSKFVSGKERTFLNANVMVAEDSNIRGDRDLLRQASVSCAPRTDTCGFCLWSKPGCRISSSGRLRIASI